jgi:hypothetical protein
MRQRDEARRVVLHLRSLISGQSHHMEHLVKSLTTPDELVAEIAAGLQVIDDDEDTTVDGTSNRTNTAFPRPQCRPLWLVCTNLDTIEAESRFIKNLTAATKRLSSSSFKDVADRHLKDKTDAIAHIIRNIAEQCHAAVESLAMAQDVDIDDSDSAPTRASRRGSNLSAAPSDDGHSAVTSEAGDETMLHPNGRISSIPPTPDLIPNRSSTSMSIASTATTPERSSQQYVMGHDIPTKIVEDDEDELDATDGESNPIPHDPSLLGKHAPSLIHRPSGARISALGGTR